MDLTLVAILGGLWGSFANVCIYRLPKDKGVVSDRSHCPKCKKKIIWYDNIPIISYLILNAKCRNCKSRISLQYPIVEMINILSFLIIFFIDLKYFIIPNSLTFSMMILGFIKSFDPNLDSIFPNYINSLIGGFFGYGIIFSIIFFYKQIRKKEGMGLGDAKLLAVIGFWFGWISIPFVIFLSSIFALVFVAPDLIKKNKKMSSQIPFGPHIILATIFYLLFKNNLDSLIY